MPNRKSLNSAGRSPLFEAVGGTAGIGARTPHLQELIDRASTTVDGKEVTELPVPWLELLADNWLSSGGATAAVLEQLATHYPLTLHGVGLSIGSVAPLDQHYLKRIASLVERSGAVVYSEHLSFSQSSAGFIPDLLPLPYSEEALRHVVNRIQQVQEILGRPILLENVSAYIASNEDDYSEAGFLAELTKRSGCRLLVDVNNYYVNEVNLGRNASAALEELPATAIAEIHLGGFEPKDGYLLDAHNNPVAEPVWQLYEQLIARIGPTPTLIEWDNDIPSMTTLLKERERAAHLLNQLPAAA